MLEKARTLIKQKKWQEAASVCREICNSDNAPPEAKYLLGAALLETGKIDEALQLLSQASQNHPQDRALSGLLGMAFFRQGQLSQADDVFSALAKSGPGDLDNLRRLAMTRHYSGQLQSAADLYRLILQRAPRDAGSWNNLSANMLALGNAEKALDHALAGLRVAPDAHELHVSAGNALLRLQRAPEAEKHYQKAVRSNRPPPQAINGLAMAKAAQGRLSEARGLLSQLTQAAPGYAEAHSNLGRVEFELGNNDRATHHFGIALKLNPNNSDIRIALGRIQTETGNYQDARTNLEAALKLTPDSIAAHTAIGAVDIQEHQHASGLRHFKAALEQDPTNQEAMFGGIIAQQKMCHWDDLATDTQKFLAQFRDNPRQRAAPLAFLSLMGATAADHLLCASRQARALVQTTPPRRYSKGASKKVRVGLLSNDFFSHATTYLAIEVLEKLDRDSFEWHAFSWSKDDGSDIRKRVVQAFDHYHPITNMSDAEAAGLIKDQEIDILIDLKAYTKGARPTISALRPAPVQINWLGHPGSMGGQFIDHIIMDPVTCPKGDEKYYSENVLRMPYCYLPSAEKRPVANPGTRTDHGLPEAADQVVFGCFNQSQKLTPDLFLIWCKLLKEVDGSVLWLLEDNKDAAVNIRRHAEKNGVSPERIIFGGFVNQEQHIARLTHMDIMLDTFYYNAHTTASDALWNGVPVVTKPGETFPSRVAASMLTACGLEELITGSDEEYLQLALKLARDPAYRQQIRERLTSDRSAVPLFDSTRFARDLEALLRGVA